MKKTLSLLLLIALAFGFATTTFAAQYHIVKKGDTLWKISQQYDVPFAEILKLNKHFKNPAMIYPNEKVIIPQTRINSGESQPQAQTESEAVLKLVNDERAKNGLGKLTLSTKLNEVAFAKSKDMAVNRYFSHQSPTYGSPFEMMQHFGVKYKTAGENIAYNQKTAAEVMNAWMNSSGHRANILNSSFGKIGIGYYNKNGNPYWVQMFTD